MKPGAVRGLDTRAPDAEASRLFAFAYNDGLDALASGMAGPLTFTACKALLLL